MRQLTNLLALTILATGVRANPDARVLGDSLIVNEVTVLTLPRQSLRLVEIARRLCGLNAQDITVPVEFKSQARAGVLVRLSGKSLFLVRPKDIAGGSQTMQGLADAWWSKLRPALLLPPLVVGQAPLVVPVNGWATFTIIGSGARKCTVNGAPLPIKVKRSLGHLSVSCSMPGNEILTLRARGQTVLLNVRFLPPAATLPQHFRATVTGNPCDREQIVAAVNYALASQAERSPGATWSVGEFGLRPMAPGMTQTLEVPVTFTANDCYPSSGFVRIDVRNGVAKSPPASVFLYANDPENIFQTGQLFWGRVKPGEVVRSMFHHCNRMPQPAILNYSLINRSAMPISVGLTFGLSGPDQNPTRAGYRAGLTFFSRYMTGSSLVVTIPALSILPLSMVPLLKGETASGLLEIHNLSKYPVELYGCAQVPGTLPGKWKPGRSPAFEASKAVPLTSYSSIIIAQPFQVYEAPLASGQLNYVCGGKYGFARIGEEGINRLDKPGTLLGDFGVQYRITVNLSNPSAEPKKLELLYEASAGYSGAVFSVDGKLLAPGILQTMQTIRLATVVLAPGELRKLMLETIPLAGAFYPGTLTVRPLVEKAGD